ncbi:tripartite tricarboxylate transporter substrate-binding protein [Marinovum sp.]|uniref:tripartite tricarboxylate transporter substrate-binding protein n=1 Tax=Marinovum sp. TaxID=2024839 RepID=UPI002B276DA7|nr:tripartite tricarboxylate transporter substrate-binding protein [Marinovum sp.]
MTLKWIKALTLVAAGMAATAAPAQDWTPPGPVTFMIGFRAGGGADTLGRILAQELSERHGWDIIPQNVEGRGGMAVATKLAEQPADGLAIGISTTNTFSYDMEAARDRSLSRDDFTFLSTLTGSQMGIVARTDRNWQTLADVIEAAKAGQRITIGVLNQQTADATYLLGQGNDVEFTPVMVKGGRDALNAVVAGDLDMAWAAGIQAAGVKSGDIVNLASAEDRPLKTSPEAPLLSDFNVPYTSLGASFIVVGPSGLPDEIAETYASHIAEILSDPESPVHAMTDRIFSGPEIVQLGALDDMLRKRTEEAQTLLRASSE